MIRVAIVDDHAILRAGIRSRLEREPDITVVGEAATAEQAIERAELVMFSLAHGVIGL